MSVSFLKVLISWVPDTIQRYTDLITALMNLNQVKLLLMSVYILLGLTCLLTLLLNQYQENFSLFGFSLCRTMPMFLDGFLCNESVVFLVQEKFQDILNQAGLPSLLFSIITVRTFSQFILFNIILNATLDYLAQGEEYGKKTKKLLEDRQQKLAEEQIIS
jgi:hypothetical protein